MTHSHLFNYKERRRKLVEQVGSGKILLIGNGHSAMNYKDNWYPFRQDSSMLYYTGIDSPDIHLLMDIDAGTETLFGDELSIDDIIWTGNMPSIRKQADESGIDRVLPLQELWKNGNGSLHYLPPYRERHTIILSELLGKDFHQIADGASKELILAIINQRNYKDDHELKEMAHAVDITYVMHQAVMRACRPGITEHELVGAASEVCFRHNSQFSYPPILTVHGEVLHNHNYAYTLNPGDLVLFDGGCASLGHYAADITRTFPVSGKWTSMQKDVYDIVHAAYTESVQALKPGTYFRDIHLGAGSIIFEGLKELGFTKGNTEDAVEAGAHTLFFQCGLGHMIGLDVHDMENLGEEYVGYGKGMSKSTEFGLKSLRLGRALEERFAITVEPGVYIIPQLIKLRKEEGLYREFIDYDVLEQNKDFGGIRIEDNFVITPKGCEIIGDPSAMPISSEEIEEFMQDV